MNQKFHLIRNYYEDGNIYEKSYVTIRPGVTVLIGCNGAGKTTMLHQIKEQCKKLEIPCLLHDNYTQGGKESISYAGWKGDTDFLIQGLISSEGERINNDLGMVAGKIGNFVRKNSTAKQLFVLLDAIDSGLSLDYVMEVKELLFQTMIDDCKNKGIILYIVVSANEYEMARGEACLDVTSCKYTAINNYEDYRKIIIATRKKKNKRYKHEDFMLE